MDILNNKKLMTILRILPFAVCIALIAFYYLSGNEFSVEALLSYTPDNALLAALALLLLFAAKSMSIVFPVLVLCAVCGSLFEPVPAVLVSLIGMGVSLSVSYFFGKFSGGSLVDSLRAKYPKLEAVIKWQENNDFFVCFFLRVINSLPLDIVSMYLGASGIGYAKYISASMLGAAPGVIAAAVIGASISDPTSPAFIYSVLLTVLLSAGSALFYYMRSRTARRGVRHQT